VRLWNSYQGGFSLVMQKGGDLVLIDAAGGSLWDSGTSTAGAFAIMPNDGNFVVYDGNLNPLWASNVRQPGGVPDGAERRHDRRPIAGGDARALELATDEPVRRVRRGRRPRRLSFRARVRDAVGMEPAATCFAALDGVGQFFALRSMASRLRRAHVRARGLVSPCARRR
jgi:hypothetical protein